MKDIMLVGLVFALAAATFRAHQAATIASEKNKLVSNVQRHLPCEGASPVQLARLPVGANGHILFRVKARRSSSLVAKASDAAGVRQLSLPLPPDAEWLGICARGIDGSDGQHMGLWIGAASKKVEVPGPRGDGITLPLTYATNDRLPIQLALSKNAAGRTIEFFVSE